MVVLVVLLLGANNLIPLAISAKAFRSRLFSSRTSSGSGIGLPVTEQSQPVPSQTVSGAELGNLIEAANMVSATDSRGPVLTILKRKQA